MSSGTRVMVARVWAATDSSTLRPTYANTLTTLCNYSFGYHRERKDLLKLPAHPEPHSCRPNGADHAGAV